MAGNFIVINSKFKPFSYADMLQPVAQATQAHQALEDQYSELASKANIWDKLANESRDSLAYSMYRGYIDDLTKQASILASEGLTPGSRANMLSMKNRYSSEITPIENAYNQRDAMIKKMQELNKDGSMIYDIDPSQLSLDAFIKDPQMTFRSYSGNAIYNAVLNGAKSLSQSIQNNPNKWESILGGQYFQSMTQKGYTPEQILLAAAMDPNAPQELKTIMDQAIDASGIKLWGNMSALAKAQQYAAMGLWAAIGDTTYKQLANQGYNAGGKGPGGGKDPFPTGYGLMYNPNDTKVISGAPRVTENLQENKRFTDLRYLTRDGRVTRRGMKAFMHIWNDLRNKGILTPLASDPAYRGSDLRTYVNMDTDEGAFYRWIMDNTKLGGDLSRSNGLFDEDHNPIESGFATIINKFTTSLNVDSPENEDTLYTRGFRIDVKGAENQKYVAQKVIGQLNEGTHIYKVGALDTSGEIPQYEKGMSVSQEEFTDLIEFNPIYQVINIPVTGQQVIRLTNGEQFLLPKGVLGDTDQDDLDSVNQRIRNHGDDTSSPEAATDLNISLRYLSSILGSDKGYSIERNDGTITYE